MDVMPDMFYEMAALGVVTSYKDHSMYLSFHIIILSHHPFKHSPMSIETSLPVPPTPNAEKVFRLGTASATMRRRTFNLT